MIASMPNTGPNRSTMAKYCGSWTIGTDWATAITTPANRATVTGRRSTRSSAGWSTRRRASHAK